MRKLLAGVAMASTMLAAPVIARDGQWYVELEGGPMILRNTDLDSGSASSIIDTKTGYDFGGLVGYDFGAFRLESETSYRRADVTSFKNTGLAPAGVNAASGDLNALSFMVNGLFDFGEDDGVQGFIGGGLGVARTSLQAGTFVNDSDSGLAWQALAGIRSAVSKNVDLGLRYRYFNAPDMKFTTVGGAGLDGKVTSHSLLATLAYNFGGAAPAPQMQTCWNGSVIAADAACPAQPVEPATQTCWNGSVIPATATCPAKPVEKVCETGPYIVFFEWDKSDITAEAAAILDNAVSAYAHCGNASVMLAGHADASGQKTYNEGLSQRRNAEVRGYLAGHGIPDDRISSQAFGESSLRVPTEDGVRELQNRRVEVTYGPNAGM